MNKTDLIDAVAKNMPDDVKVTKAEIEAVLESLALAAADFLNTRGECTIPYVAKLLLVTTSARPERIARNPKTGESVRVAARPQGKKLKAKWLKFLRESTGATKVKS